MSIHEISDRMEIEQLLIRYCHAIDERDWDTYRSVYTDDAVIDDIGAGPGNTVDQMVEFLRSALEKVVLIQHGISTSRVDIAMVTLPTPRPSVTAPWCCQRPTAGPRCSFRACGTKTSS